MPEFWIIWKIVWNVFQVWTPAEICKLVRKSDDQNSDSEFRSPYMGMLKSLKIIYGHAEKSENLSENHSNIQIFGTVAMANKQNQFRCPWCLSLLSLLINLPQFSTLLPHPIYLTLVHHIECPIYICALWLSVWPMITEQGIASTTGSPILALHPATPPKCSTTLTHPASLTLLWQ